MSTTHINHIDLGRQNRGALAIEELLVQQAEQYLLPKPLLLNRRPDPLWWQNESEVTIIRELDRKRELSAADRVDMIDRRSRSWVECGSTRTESESSAVVGLCSDFLTYESRRTSPFAEFWCI